MRFSSDLSFFADWLESAQEQWLVPLQKLFGPKVIFRPQFDGKPAEKKEREPVKLTSPIPKRTTPPAKQYQKKFNTKRSQVVSSFKGRIMDVSDQAVWQKTNMILRHFPGKVIMIAENRL